MSDKKISEYKTETKKPKNMNRLELLELLLKQQQYIEHLESELEDVKNKLEKRQINIEKVGSIAEASLALTNIFEEAQKAADLYLENIKNRNGGDQP